MNLAKKGVRHSRTGWALNDNFQLTDDAPQTTLVEDYKVFDTKYYFEEFPIREIKYGNRKSWQNSCTLMQK